MDSSILTAFSSLSDSRRASGHYLYPLNELLFLVISGVLSGCEDWVNISEFGKNQLSWLRKYFPYESGIPSHDTLGRVFSLLDSSSFEACFVNWVSELSLLTNSGIISIDGKCIRNSYDTHSSKAAIHIVSAFGNATGLCLGQVRTEDKSNEITAIPVLLDMLFLKDTLVTIDAMGCQREIVKQITEQEADYVISLKANQKELFAQAQQAFQHLKPSDEDHQIDAGHGRVEERHCQIIDQLEWVDEASKWQHLRSVVRVKAQRTNKTTGETTEETRFYISSLTQAAKINEAVRAHWTIENSLHWVLDVQFNEDKERKRKDHAPYNFSFITKAIINLIKLDQSKGSIKTKRLRAAWDNKTREKILRI